MRRNLMFNRECSTKVEHFYYLPNQRAFYANLELLGIVMKGEYFSDRADLDRLYEKLSSIREE